MSDKKTRDHNCGNYEAGGSMHIKNIKVVIHFALFNFVVLSLYLSSFCTHSSVLWYQASLFL